MRRARFGILWMVAALLVGITFSGGRAQEAAKMKRYIYVLHLTPRLYDDAAWTESDNKSVGDHFARLQKATAEGKVILAGRTDEPGDRTFGIVIFEAADDSAAAEFSRTDPAVVAGVMTVDVHPFAIALMKK